MLAQTTDVFSPPAAPSDTDIMKASQDGRSFPDSLRSFSQSALCLSNRVLLSIYDG